MKEQMKLKDKEFCKMYTSYFGEEIDKKKQLVKACFDGEELREFIEHCIEFKANSVLGGVINIDCKDCSDRGVLYDENGNTTNCPCHYL